MQHVGTNCLPEPLRGTRGWWQQLGRLESVTPPTRKKKKKKRTAGKNRELFRAALVARVRREIAAGTYDSADKWHLALDKLLDQISA